MDVEPPWSWQMFKLKFIWHLPGDVRKKIKRFIKLGESYLAKDERELGEYCFELSKELAEAAGTIHLLKKIEQKTMEP